MPAKPAAPNPETRIDFSIDGLSCASCVGRVERAVAAVPGVKSAAVNLATGRMRVERAADSAVGARDLTAAVESAGYSASLLDEARPAGPESSESALHDQHRALMIAGALTLPVVVLEMGGHMAPAFHHWLVATLGQTGLNILLFVLTSAVLFGPGRAFFTKGWPALKRGAPDMNALVMLGTGAAWGYSTIATFAPRLLPEGSAQVYFEAAAVIVTLILLGRWLEARARGRASEAIAQLVRLQPRTANVLRDGSETATPVEDLVPGDVLRVRPGERIPVDGQVLEGSTWIDEAMITGEPVPAEKGPGSDVTGGTINTSGSVTCRVTKVGQDTLLARIVRMVEEAQGDKLPIQALVDKVTLWFVPAVIAAAVLTFAVWMIFGPAPALALAIVNGVAVLIVACPCAMGLATPTSILVGSGRAAENGMLFRRGAALQSLSGAGVVAFDKTGTLTEGRPRLTDFELAPGRDRTEILGLIAAVEAHSEHPAARAIVDAARAEGLEPGIVEGFEAVPGMGATGRVDGRIVAVGADRYLASLDAAPDAFADTATRLAGMGRTPLYAAIDGEPVAVLAVSDAIRPEARDAVAALRGMGLEVAMITGDNARTADAVARELGIETVVAEVLPGGKVDAVRRFQASGRAVAFVGDGINDAPALAQAETGIAIGTGTDIAIEAADVALISGDLRNVSGAVELSRAVMRNIRQNLFWAFAYNAALIPVAAGVLYPASGILMSPVLAAGAMAISSICVVTNALRLRRFTPSAQASGPDAVLEAVTP